MTPEEIAHILDSQGGKLAQKHLDRTPKKIKLMYMEIDIGWLSTPAQSELFALEDLEQQHYSTTWTIKLTPDRIGKRLEHRFARNTPEDNIKMLKWLTEHAAKYGGTATDHWPMQSDDMADYIRRTNADWYPPQRS